MDYAEKGRELILEASQGTLEFLASERPTRWDRNYGSLHPYQLALRVIGEEGMAEGFADPECTAKSLVRVEGCWNSGLGAAVITYLQEGREEMARSIEEELKIYSLMPGSGYLNPHTTCSDARERDGSIKREDPSKKVSVDNRQTLYGVNISLALGQREQAREVLSWVGAVDSDGNEGPIFYVDSKTSWEERSSIGCTLQVKKQPWGVRSDLLRSMRYAGLTRIAEEDFGRLRKSIAEEAFREIRDEVRNNGGNSDQLYGITIENLSRVCLMLDSFGDEERLKHARGLLLPTVLKLREEGVEVKKSGIGPVHLGNHDTKNQNLIRYGLALTGIGQEEPLRYYSF